MDWDFFVLVPKTKFAKLGFEEIKISWGGKWHSQEPRKYKLLSALVGEEFPDINFFKRVAGDLINVHKYRAFLIKGDVFAELQRRVNSGDAEKIYWARRSEIILLFRKMFEVLDTFCIVKLRDEEEIDARHIVLSADELVDIFIDSLKWESRKGIILVKGNI